LGLVDYGFRISRSPNPLGRSLTRLNNSDVNPPAAERSVPPAIAAGRPPPSRPTRSEVRRREQWWMPFDLGSKGVRCQPEESLRGFSAGSLLWMQFPLPDARSGREVAGKGDRKVARAAAKFLGQRTSTGPGRAKSGSVLCTSATGPRHQPSPESLKLQIGCPSSRRRSR
jgi:hypothetical protein